MRKRKKWREGINFLKVSHQIKQDKFNSYFLKLYVGILWHNRVEKGENYVLTIQLGVQTVPAHSIFYFIFLLYIIDSLFSQEACRFFG